jgi:putative heme iron utilization protein
LSQPQLPAGAQGKTLSKNSSSKSLIERKRLAEEMRAEFESRLKIYEEARKKKKEDLLT